MSKPFDRDEVLKRQRERLYGGQAEPAFDDVSGNVTRLRMDENNRWPAPVPLDEPPAPPSVFPLAALGPLEAVARDIARVRKCPPALAAASVLGAAALAVSSRYDAAFRGGQSVPCSLFILTLAASGERKTAVDKLANLGVERHERQLRKQNRTAKLAKEAGIDDGAEILCPVIRINSGTVEGIMRGFVEGHPCQMLLSDEAGRFLGGHSLKREQKLNGLTSLSKFWDCAPDTKRTRGTGAKSETLVIQDYRLTTHLLGQRVAIAPFLDDPIARAQGILARFLVHEPPSFIGSRTETSEEWNTNDLTPAIEAFASAIEGHLQNAVPWDEFRQCQRPVIPNDIEASEALRIFFNDLETELGPNGQLRDQSSLVNKAHENAARIAGVLAGFENTPTVTGQTMKAAISIARYFLSEAKRLEHTDMTISGASHDQAMKLAEWIAAKGGDVPTRQLNRTGPKSSRKISDREDAEAMLCEAHWLRVSDGRHTLNPALLGEVSMSLPGRHGRKGRHDG